MVLLNGVKYACERCIRGHRVSSCTHTDKPLTMIKPKGRPASQCPHCREQRKLKNTHSSCSCGKKGKSPGQHLASCLCHKNSHCTCPIKDKKDVKVKKDRKLGDKPIGSRPPDGYGDERSIDAPGSSLNLNYFIEDVVVPFETELGLLDFFSSDRDKQDSSDNSAQNGSSTNVYQFKEEYANNVQSGHSEKPLHPQQLQGLNNFPNPPSDSDLDLMENMFPLFPLVGTCSFDDSNSLPLLPMPLLANPNGAALGARNGEKSGSEDERLYNIRMAQHGNFGQARPEGAPLQTSGSQFASGGSNTPQQHHLSSNHQSSTSLSTMNTAISTQHPRPLKPSTSFSNNYPHLSARPRRPESVLSIASTSSNTSKQNLLESSLANQHTLPKLSSSAAFPPFHLSGINSTDDLQNNFFDSSGVFNDAQLLSILSDYEEFSKGGQHPSVSATPQSSLPSRQPLQLRRKSSLTRSHSQLHHNHGVMNKEHPLMPLKSASSSESSPRQTQHFFSPASEQAGQFKNQNSTFELQPQQDSISEKWNELQGYPPLEQRGLQQSPSSPMGDAIRQADLDDRLLASQQNAILEFVEYLELGAIPMYHDFVSP